MGLVSFGRRGGDFGDGSNRGSAVYWDGTRFVRVETPPEPFPKMTGADVVRWIGEMMLERRTLSLRALFDPGSLPMPDRYWPT